MYMVKLIVSAAIAGSLTGLLGAGGGSVLVLLLAFFKLCDEQNVFFVSLTIMIPVTICVLLFTLNQSTAVLSFSDTLPYLIGGMFGGVIAGKSGGKINARWLHLVFGLLVIWGGIQFLC